MYAESPSTVRGLWTQRVRWGRGLLQTTGMHPRLIGNPRHGSFGPYLVFNTFTQLVVPVLQVVVLVVLAVLAATGDWRRVPTTFWGIVLFFGLPLAVLLLALAVVVDGAWSDFRFAWTLWLWPFYSVLMSCAMLWAMWLELTKAENRWNKLDRTGVVSVAFEERGRARAGPGSAPRASSR